MNNINAKTISPAGDWLAFSIPVSQANALFGANYSVFEHEATGSQITRTLSYSIPSELQGHLELVHPSISFDVPVNQSPVNVTRPTASSLNTTSSTLGARQSLPFVCEFEMVPVCLQRFYGIPTELATQSTKSVLPIKHFIKTSIDQIYSHIGVVSLFNEVVNVEDFQEYFLNFRPDIPEFTFSVLSVDGGTNSQTAPASVFADAYTQITAGLASNVPMTLIAVGTETNDGPVCTFSE